MSLNFLLLSASLACLVLALLMYVVLRRRIRKLTEWMKRTRTGEAGSEELRPPRGMLAPLTEEVKTLARNLSKAQQTAEHEARLRELGDSLWTAERLREHVKNRLRGRPLLVVSHREPYRHVHRDGSIVSEMPASGLVTGVEPILRACGGTWLAHGDGDADRETADAKGKLKVPPGHAQYLLRRLWLEAEQERGFYLGLSNEGLWPLCHIAHTRPVFRSDDWNAYQQVNEAFAEAVLEEIDGAFEPFIFIQDYHFTLLPRLIKDRRPDARIALFWHIPWPNPEAFGICPWQREILDGMLGADVLGFHTQFHCNNFFETADRALECRIDRERFAVKRQGHATVVKPFPISVAFEEASANNGFVSAAEARKQVLRQNEVEADFVAVGVDRADYTKGIVERFLGVERFLDQNPVYRGRFTLFQIGAPSRTEIDSYRRLGEEIAEQARRINERFGGSGARPIVLLSRHHSHTEIARYYRAADVCLVTPLHDGMNLVAKEFVGAREDEDGVLVLSRFAGASRQLRDALIVNPYDADQLSKAIRSALEMDSSERALRMVRMRAQVRENNIYRWGADLLSELAAVRLPATRT